MYVMSLVDQGVKPLPLDRETSPILGGFETISSIVGFIRAHCRTRGGRGIEDQNVNP